MKKTIITGLIWAASVFLAVGLYAYISTNKKEFDQYRMRNYQIFAPPIPQKLDFCGEAVPLNRFDVYENLDNELLKNVFGHSTTIQMIKRSHRWLPLIDSILKKNNIPSDFKYVALIESFLSNVISPAGATGYWQFMKTTGIEFDLEINEEVDERYDVAKSTEAACKYFKSAYKTLNNWTLVAASYNMGVVGVAKKADQYNTRSYYDISLNSETARYVYRILAVKLIIENPRLYGFLLRECDKYPPIKTHIVTSDTCINDLMTFAKSHNISYKVFKYFNPWLRSQKLTNKNRKTYSFQIPDSTFYQFDYTIDNMSSDFIPEYMQDSLSQ